MPIYNSKFKTKYLAKHALLIRQKDPATGILITCQKARETRALGQAKALLESMLSNLFPDSQSIWPDRTDPDDLEIDREFIEDTGDDEKDIEVVRNGSDAKGGKKDRTLQAVDTASAGCIFYRFRINVNPVDFTQKMFDFVKAASVEDRNRWSVSLFFSSFSRFSFRPPFCSLFQLSNSQDQNR